MTNERMEELKAAAQHAEHNGGKVSVSFDELIDLVDSCPRKSDAVPASVPEVKPDAKLDTKTP